jgi:hypothetical protein
MMATVPNEGGDKPDYIYRTGVVRAAMEGANTPRKRGVRGATAADAENVIAVFYTELGTVVLAPRTTVNTSHLQTSAMSCLVAGTSEERTTTTTTTTWMRRILTIDDVARERRFPTSVPHGGRARRVNMVPQEGWPSLEEVVRLSEVEPSFPSGGPFHHHTPMQR